jgi:hypothetical protein
VQNFRNAQLGILLMVVLPKHQLLFRQLQDFFSCDLIPSRSFSFILSNSSCVNTVFKAPSAIKA